MSTPKRQRTSLGDVKSTAKTPTQVLLDMKNDRRSVDEARAFRALCSCVISAANGDDETIYLNCLQELLDVGANPNLNKPEVMEITGGAPLHIAVKLNVPRAVQILCENGASLVLNWEGKTPLQLAYELNATDSIAEIYNHIEYLESLQATDKN
jgi:hypothetical protein